MRAVARAGLKGGRNPVQAVISGVRGDMADPLFRNAYALVANGAFTGMLGLAYWTLGALLYHDDPAAVGRNWATIQAIMFVGGVTMLNFLLIRFVPQTAGGTGRLVLACYGIGAAAALLLALAFLLVVPSRAPVYGHLDGWTAGTWFLLLAVGWNLFNQQEAVFTGLRHATWVPVVNLTFGVAKLALLALLALTLHPQNGIVLSWFVPMLVALVPVNAFLFGRLIPRHRERGHGRGDRTTCREIVRYFGGGYLGGIFQYASISLIPVVVTSRLHDDALNAYFQMAWALGMMLELLAMTLSLSLTVEGAFDPSALAASTRAALRRTFMLMLPAVVLAVVACPVALKLLGPGYAAQGAPLLQLLAIAVLPKAVIELYVGVLRVRSQTRLIATVQGVRLLGVLALVPLLFHGTRLTTIGMVVLGVNLMVAVAILPALRRACAPGASGAPVMAGGGT
ncbi:Membrane protein involved in the export of O-antigen and teichoic acid [Thermomonospora echinospora]|uniref:Membrane protein involved in the export of O-antigen and teichoic acid n=1 Tax=Thermomonospora echinospora TaxID=1992 RepID=A0A1H5UY95_9ACTN|nr:Membrane protein involved in the export of O-antigen and teichoic acid [Thermomonospora echinospora]